VRAVAEPIPPATNLCNPAIRRNCRMKNYNYQIKAINRCGNSLRGTIGEASINPMIPSDILVDVWADITLVVKDGYSQLMEQTLTELSEGNTNEAVPLRLTQGISAIAGLSLFELTAVTDEEILSPLFEPDDQQIVNEIFEGKSQASEIILELTDDEGTPVSPPMHLRTNLFGQIQDLYLGKLISGKDYYLTIVLENERYVLPKKFPITINSARPSTTDEGLTFSSHLTLRLNDQFCFGDFEEDGDIDLEDLIELKNIIENEEIAEIHQFAEINIDGLSGFDLADLLTMQKNFPCTKDVGVITN